MEKTIDLGLSVSADSRLVFQDFLDPERLLRLHPHWHVLSSDTRGHSISARLKDHATDETFELAFTMTFPGPLELVVDLAAGPVEKIHFFVRDHRLHTSYVNTHRQLSSEDEKNLTLWLQSIRQYIRLYLTTTPYTLFFRALMNRALLKMNPSQRKICLMLYRFTLLEIVVIFIIVIGYFTFGR